MENPNSPWAMGSKIRLVMIKNICIALGCVLTLVGCGGPGKDDPKLAALKRTATVTKGDLGVQVIETGTLDSAKTVELKSQVGGRVAKLLFDEGDVVQAGQLIAVIDPQQTQLQLEQNQAQLRGAQSGVQKLGVDLSKRRLTARNNIDRFRSKVKMLEMELKIQPDLTNAAVRSAKSSLDNAEQQLLQLSSVTQRNNRTSAENNVKDAENNLANTKSEQDRRKELLDKGYISQRDFETALLNVQLAETKVKAAREVLDRIAQDQNLERMQAQEKIKQARAQYQTAIANSIQDKTKKEQYIQALADLRDAQADLSDISSIQAQRSQQVASVDQLKSVVGDAQRQLRETDIRAPMNGVVTKRYVQVGELVTSAGSFNSGTAIYRVEDRSGMVVKLNINEIDVAKLILGGIADVRVDAFPDKQFNGRVTKIAPARVDAAPGSSNTDAVVKYAVEVKLDSADVKLKSGMSAKCTLSVDARHNVLKLPQDYIGKDTKDKTRFVMLAPVGKDGKPMKVVVKVGSVSGNDIEVLDGLTEGQIVVKPKYGGPPRQGMMQFGPDDSDSSTP